VQLSTPMKVDEQKPKQQNLSRAIDRSANERTFLAWMRAAIALMAFGFVIVRLRVVQLPVQYRHAMGWKLGLIFSLVGLATVLISTKHYFTIRHQIDHDTYEPPDGMVLWLRHRATSRRATPRTVPSRDGVEVGFNLLSGRFGDSLNLNCALLRHSPPN